MEAGLSPINLYKAARRRPRGEWKSCVMHLFMTHDLNCVIEQLTREADYYTRSPGYKRVPDLAVAAVAFTIQCAIEAGRDPDEMRALERELVAKLAPREGGCE